MLLREERRAAVLHVRGRAILESMEGLAVEVLHRDEVVLIDVTDLVRLNDVRMIQARRDACLVDEHRDELGLVGEVSTEPLDDSELAEARTDRPRLHCQENIGHPSMA